MLRQFLSNRSEELRRPHSNMCRSFRKDPSLHRIHRCTFCRQTVRRSVHIHVPLRVWSCPSQQRSCRLRRTFFPCSPLPCRSPPCQQALRRYGYVIRSKSYNMPFLRLWKSYLLPSYTSRCQPADLHRRKYLSYRQ